MNQTSRERFGVAEAMLQDALAAEPDNIDLAVALAGLQLRGVQMAWYTPQEATAIKARTEATLERALRVKPDHIPVSETYCRFLSTSNRFVESLVECSDRWARTMERPCPVPRRPRPDLSRAFRGRAGDVPASRPVRTPQVSRWTWLLGAGWANVLLGRPEAAIPWLQRSIAITPGSGRSHMLLAAAYQQAGRTDEARAAMQEGLRVRYRLTPPSTSPRPPPTPARPMFRLPDRSLERWSRRDCRSAVGRRLDVCHATPA